MASTIANANATTHNTSEPLGAAEEPATNEDGHNEPTTQPEVTTGGGGTGKGKGKLTKGKGKGKDAATTFCANCGEQGDARCTGCGVVYYCRKNIVIKNGKRVNLCQQVMVQTRTPFATSSAHLLLRHILHHRSTGSAVATRARARPSCSQMPSRHSRTGCARRRSRRTGASSAWGRRATPPCSRAVTYSARDVCRSCGQRV